MSGGVRIFTQALRAYHLDIGMPDPAEVLAAALASRDGGSRFRTRDGDHGILAACDDLALFRRPASTP